MKSIKRYTLAITSLTIMLFLLASICTLLKYNFDTNERTLFIIQGIVGTILFLATGLLIGTIYEKKGYLHGFILALIYLIALFIYTRFDKDVSIVNICIKPIVLFIGSIIGVNMRKRKS